MDIGKYREDKGDDMFLKKISEIPLDAIIPGKGQPRKTFGDEELRELSDSIRKYGVIQPVILKRSGYGKYTIIAGERRTRAAALAGLRKIPAVIREEDEKDSAILALVENVQREDLNYMEEAEAYKRLMDEHGLTQQEIADRVGKKQSTVSNKIRLLALPEDIRESLAEHRLTERHARALLKVDEPEVRRTVLKRVIDNGLNVRQTEKLIEDLMKKTEDERRRLNKVCYINYKIYVNSIVVSIVIPNKNEKRKECFT